MQRLIHTAATMAALTAVVVAIASDFSLLAALKRVLVSYLAFFFVGSVLALIFKAGVLAEARRSDPEEGTRTGPAKVGESR